MIAWRLVNAGIPIQVVLTRHCSAVGASQAALNGRKTFYVCRFLLGFIEGYVIYSARCKAG
jgi:hypothetical protein